MYYDFKIFLQFPRTPVEREQKKRGQKQEERKDHHQHHHIYLPNERNNRRSVGRDGKCKNRRRGETGEE